MNLWISRCGFGAFVVNACLRMWAGVRSDDGGWHGCMRKRGFWEGFPESGIRDDSSILGSRNGLRKDWKIGEWSRVVLVFVGVGVVFYGPLKEIQETKGDQEIEFFEVPSVEALI